MVSSRYCVQGPLDPFETESECPEHGLQFSDGYFGQRSVVLDATSYLDAFSQFIAAHLLADGKDLQMWVLDQPASLTTALPITGSADIDNHGDDGRTLRIGALFGRSADTLGCCVADAVVAHADIAIDARLHPDSGDSCWRCG